MNKIIGSVIIMVFLICLPATVLLANGISPAKSSIEQEQITLKNNLQQILADPRFNYPDRFAGIKQLIEKILLFLSKIKPTPAEKADLNIIELIIKWLGLILVVILPFLISYFLSKMFRGEPGQPLIKTESQPEATPEQLSIKANHLAESGAYLEAIHYFYLASLLRLKKEKLLPDSVQLTDKESLLKIAQLTTSDHPVYTAYANLIRLFQEKWYGLKNCNQEDFQQAQQYYAMLTNLVGKVNAKN